MHRVNDTTGGLASAIVMQIVISIVVVVLVTYETVRFRDVRHRIRFGE